jgi:hypothetical protein
MIAQVKRGLVVLHAAFTSASSTLIAQLLIVALLGVVTLVGMSDVARQESQTTSAE